MTKNDLIGSLKDSEQLRSARSIKPNSKGRLKSIKGPFSLIRLLIQRGPSKFMNQNPAYAKYFIGNFSYGFPEIFDAEIGSKLKIGKFCSFAPGVKIILSAEHLISSISTYPFDIYWGGENTTTSKGDITIGNDVWVGFGAIILSGVTIGDGAVIGAGSVVTQDIPSYSIAVGNPAKVLRYRFDPVTIDYLLKIQWWNWSIAKIEKERLWLMNSEGKRLLDGIMSHPTESTEQDVRI